MPLHGMEIESISHKKLRKFVESGNPQGLIEVERLRDMIAFILAADSFEALATPPNFGFHALKGNWSGSFAMTVTRNWRLTFKKVDAQTIGNLDLEDYH
jgi:toxin HigB-1